MADNVNKEQDKMDQNFQAPFFINDQYVKDFSFENPNYLIKYRKSKEQPQVSVNVETNVSKVQDGHYEVSMKIDVKSFIGNKDIFVLELVYGALVTVDQKLANDVLEPILLVHCPFLMFPFVRGIVADTTRNGGYPPLLLEPIDFASLYVEKKKKETANTDDSGNNSVKN